MNTERTASAGTGDWAVELEGVTKRFGGFTAVDEMTLQIARGEFFSLLGPSGCGKTTTLRLIAGFEQPSAGAIRLDGEDIAKVPPYRRHVNTVFQSYALFEHLDVRENVAFGLRRRKVAKPEIEQRVSEALELVALDQRATARPGELSGGQRQRVALARALVNRPSVLLLDEPLGALDLKLRKQMQVELKRIQREVGITFVYVTHDQEEALAMSDRIAVMSDGVVEQLGEPEDVYERPLRAFVAGFIGISNLLPATVEGSGVRLSTGALVPAPIPDGLPDGAEVQLSVRPEKLLVDELEDGMATVEGTIAERVYMGTATQLIVELAPGARLVALEQNTARARADDRWSWATACASAGTPSTARCCADARRARPRRRPGRARRGARPGGRRRRRRAARGARPARRARRAGRARRRPASSSWSAAVGSFHTASRPRGGARARARGRATSPSRRDELGPRRGHRPGRIAAVLHRCRHRGSERIEAALRRARRDRRHRGSLAPSGCRRARCRLLRRLDPPAGARPEVLRLRELGALALAGGSTERLSLLGRLAWSAPPEARRSTAAR